MARFVVAVQGIDGIEDSVIMIVLSSGMKGNQYVASLVRCPVKTLAEAMTHAQEEMRVEDILAATRVRPHCRIRGKCI